MAHHARQLASALLLRVPHLGAASQPAAFASASFPAALTRGLCSGATRLQEHSNDARCGNSTASSWPLLGAIASAAAAAGLTSASADAPVAPPAVPNSGSSDADYVRPAAKGLPKEITLYQYEVCPFCCKVKAALDFYKIPYKVIEVNPLTKTELKWSSYKKVPVVQLDEEVLTGSSAIMSRVAAEAEASSSGSGGSQAARQDAKSASAALAAREEETRWRKWVDDWFVKLLTANIYRSWDEAWGTFRYITEQTNWSWGTREVARMSGAVLMWQVGKRMPKKYNIQGDLREELYKACNEFVDAVGPNRPFMGGAQPNLADLAVFGVLQAVRNTPTFNDAMANSRIGAWFGRVEAAIGAGSRVSTGGSAWSLAPKAK